MKFKYRGHVITVNDKIVECFTSYVDPTITSSLFDMYLIDADGNEDLAIEDIDLTQFSDEELSRQFEECMAEECQVLSEVKNAWNRELKRNN